MELIADRFVNAGGGVLDLATGERIVLKRLPGGEPGDEVTWASRSAAHVCRYSERGAQLIDFGSTGPGERFEAWTTGPASTASCMDRLPAAADHAFSLLTDAVDDLSGARTRALVVYAPDPTLAGAVAAHAARHARRSGIVPVSTRLLDRSVRRPDGTLVPLTDLLAGRTLLLLHTGAAPGAALVNAVIASPKPHLLVCATAARVRGLECITLPGATTRAVVARPVLRVAEEAAAYGPGEEPEPAAQADTPRAAAAGSDVVAWRRRVSEAQVKFERGRHAGGERLLRQAIGGLTRRGDWSAAGEALNTLARALLKRGRPTDALTELGRAREVLARVRDEPHLIDSAILAGRARLQLVRLDEAEATFSAAVTASTTAGDGARVNRASAALANVLLWQGRYDEARQLAERAADRDGHHAAAIGTVRVIACVGAGRLREALSTATAVAETAREISRPAAMARAAALSAFTHLALGELDPVARELDEATRAATAAGDRLLVVRCRLLAAESARRRNCRGAAASVVARLARVGESTLPALLRAHVRLVSELLAATDPPNVVAARHARATGLMGLELLVPAADRPAQPVDAADVLEILHVCQSADDEQQVLRELCARLAVRLHASAVGVYLAGGTEAMLVSSHGSRADSPIGNRAIVAGIVIEPHRHEDRIEAAAPVRYGGAVIGAITARWAPASPYLRGHAGGVLATAAAAIAPALEVVRTRRALPQAAELIGASSGSRDLRDAIDRAAAAPFPVLIQGESGSGKELVARTLHRRGSRRDRAFCTLNFVGLPEDLVESELFGHARGSFTGATGDRAGVFEEAHGGTLLLDEVGELSPRAQAKVLRVVQEGELRRVGENAVRHVDVRLVAATNRDLRREAEAGRFRTDLLYRLDVIRIVVPPLRERRDDIPLLVEYYWREAASRVGSRAVLSAATMAALARYDWPGNVRELQNVLASLAVRAARRGVVGPAALPPLFDAGPARASCRLDDARRTFESQFVRAALARAGGRRTEAAEELGLTRQGLTKLIARLGIEG